MRETSIIISCIVIISVVIGMGGVSTIHAATFTVITTGDSGPGSFRDAIIQSNGTTEADTIIFNIPGAGVQVIRPDSPFPAIAETAVIDGYSQPGAVPATSSDPAVILIVLDGINTSGADGLILGAYLCEVRGLAIGRFPQQGIKITSGAGGVIAGNHVGIDASGWLSMENGIDGIRLGDYAYDWRIGGSSAAERNVVSSNGQDGIHVTNYSSGNIILGNYVGLDASGSLPMGNGHDGILLGGYSYENTVGGTIPGARNVVCDNVGGGVTFATYTRDNIVMGNYLGVDASGMNGMGNHKMGAGLVHYASNNTIGGSVVGSGNVISANDWSGIHIEDAVSGTLILGNLIGLTAGGMSPLGNSQHGINLIGGTWGNTIGGEGECDGNTIRCNALHGVAITAGIGNEILCNVIFENQGLGIDLGNNGVTSNDEGDGDMGPNSYQNYPILLSVTSDNSNPIVAGRLNSLPNTEYRLEFFASSAVDPTLYGEGEIPLMSQMITTDPASQATFRISLPSFIQDGYWISATATDPIGNTSEFCKSRFFFVLDAVEMAGEAVLTWTEVPGADAYWIYGSRDTAYFVPYVSPGYENRIAIVDAPATTWSSPQGIGDPELNWTYLVIAVDSMDREMARTNRAGEMDFQL